MSEEKDEIKISEIVELIEKPLKEFEEEITDRELSVTELEKVLEAEKSDKDRGKAKRFIRRELKKQKIVDQVNTAESDIEEIKNSLDYIRDEKDLERIGDTEELDRHELLEIVGGTVDDLRNYLDEHYPSKKQLKELLEAEEIVKDRKTAKEALENELNKRKLEEDVENAEEDVEKLEKDIEALETDSENSENNDEIFDEEIGESEEDIEPETVEDQIESEEDDFEEFEEDIEQAETDDELQKAMEEAEDKLNEDEKDDLDEFIEDLEKEESDLFDEDEKDDVETGSNQVIDAEIDEEDEDESTEDNSDNEISDEDISMNTEISESQEKSGSNSPSDVNKSSEEEETVEDEDDKDDTPDKGEEDEDESTEDNPDSDEEDEKDNFEEKKEILDDLDVELSDEEIQEISLEELKDIKQEKLDRERLISKLTEEGLNEETLRNSSTKDLKKLSKDLIEDEDEEKDTEEIEEEAQEDLEMLMGAGRSDNTETEKSKDRFKGIKDTKQKIMGLIHGEKEKTDSNNEEKTRTQKMEQDSIIEVLEKYRDLEDQNEAAIKTAHVMKGFLEYHYNIDKEKTYKQLAEELKEKREDENFQEFLEFLKKLHEDEYIGNINIDNIDEVIDNAESVVKDLD